MNKQVLLDGIKQIFKIITYLHLCVRIDYNTPGIQRTRFVHSPSVNRKLHGETANIFCYRNLISSYP